MSNYNNSIQFDNYSQQQSANATPLQSERVMFKQLIQPNKTNLKGDQDYSNDVQDNEEEEEEQILDENQGDTEIQSYRYTQTSSPLRKTNKKLGSLQNVDKSQSYMDKLGQNQKKQYSQQMISENPSVENITSAMLNQTSRDLEDNIHSNIALKTQKYLEKVQSLGSQRDINSKVQKSLVASNRVQQKNNIDGSDENKNSVQLQQNTLNQQQMSNNNIGGTNNSQFSFQLQVNNHIQYLGSNNQPPVSPQINRIQQSQISNSPLKQTTVQKSNNLSVNSIIDNNKNYPTLPLFGAPSPQLKKNSQYEYNKQQSNGSLNGNQKQNGSVALNRFLTNKKNSTTSTPAQDIVTRKQSRHITHTSSIGSSKIHRIIRPTVIKEMTKRFIKLLIYRSNMKNISYVSKNVISLVSDLAFSNVENSTQKFIRNNRMSFTNNNINESVLSPSALKQNSNQIGFFEKIQKKYAEKVPIWNPLSTVIIGFQLIFCCIMSVAIFMMPLEMISKELFVENIWWFKHYLKVAVFFIIIKIFLSFNISYNFAGNYIFDRKLIARKYLKGYFIGDILSLIPFILDISGISSLNTQFLKKPHGFILIQFWSYFKLLEKLMEYYITDRGKYYILQLCYLFLQSATLGHFIAYFYWGLAIVEVKYGVENTSWLIETNLIDNVWHNKYTHSLYFSVTTMTTVGFGDYVPKTVSEMYFVVFSMMISSAFFAYVLTYLGEIIIEKSREKQQYKKQLTLLNKYLSKKNIDEELQSEVRNFFSYQLRNQHEISYEEEQEVFEKLSKELKSRITINANIQLLQKVKIFSEFTELTQKRLALQFQEQSYQENEMIYWEGDIEENPRLYFIESGQVDIFIETFKGNIESTLFKKQNSREAFGQTAFITNRERLSCAQVCCRTRIFYLPRIQALDIIKENTLDYERFCKLENELVLQIPNKYSKCVECQLELGHSTFQCPFLHFIPDRTKIILQENFTTSHKVRKIQERKGSKYDTLKQFRDVKESGKSFKKTLYKKLYQYYHPYESTDEAMDKNDDIMIMESEARLKIAALMMISQKKYYEDEYSGSNSFISDEEEDYDIYQQDASQNQNESQPMGNRKNTMNSEQSYIYPQQQQQQQKIPQKSNKKKRNSQVHGNQQNGTDNSQAKLTHVTSFESTDSEYMDDQIILQNNNNANNYDYINNDNNINNNNNFDYLPKPLPIIPEHRHSSLTDFKDFLLKNGSGLSTHTLLKMQQAEGESTGKTDRDYDGKRLSLNRQSFKNYQNLEQFKDLQVVEEDNSTSQSKSNSIILKLKKGLSQQNRSTNNTSLQQQQFQYENQKSNNNAFRNLQIQITPEELQQQIENEYVHFNSPSHQKQIEKFRQISPITTNDQNEVPMMSMFMSYMPQNIQQQNQQMSLKKEESSDLPPMGTSDQNNMRNGIHNYQIHVSENTPNDKISRNREKKVSFINKNRANSKNVQNTSPTPVNKKGQNNNNNSFMNLVELEQSKEISSGNVLLVNNVRKKKNTIQKQNSQYLNTQNTRSQLMQSHESLASAQQASHQQQQKIKNLQKKYNPSKIARTQSKQNSNLQQQQQQQNQNYNNNDFFGSNMMYSNPMNVGGLSGLGLYKQQSEDSSLQSQSRQQNIINSYGQHLFKQKLDKQYQQQQNAQNQMINQELYDAQKKNHLTRGNSKSQFQNMMKSKRGSQILQPGFSRHLLKIAALQSQNESSNNDSSSKLFQKTTSINTNQSLNKSNNNNNNPNGTFNNNNYNNNNYPNGGNYNYYHNNNKKHTLNLNLGDNRATSIVGYNNNFPGNNNNYDYQQYLLQQQQQQEQDLDYNNNQDQFYYPGETGGNILENVTIHEEPQDFMIYYPEFNRNIDNMIKQHELYKKFVFPKQFGKYTYYNRRLQQNNPANGRKSQHPMKNKSINLDNTAIQSIIKSTLNKGNMISNSITNSSKFQQHSAKNYKFSANSAIKKSKKDTDLAASMSMDMMANSPMRKISINAAAKKSSFNYNVIENSNKFKRSASKANNNL